MKQWNMLFTSTKKAQIKPLINKLMYMGKLKTKLWINLKTNLKIKSMNIKLNKPNKV